MNTRNIPAGGIVKPIIEFKNVKVTYKNGTTALDGVNIRIDEGEFVFITGESGAGKSTLMKLMLREIKPTGGILRVMDQDIGHMSNMKVPKYRRKLGVVFQDFRLLPRKTARENVAFVMRAIGGDPARIRYQVTSLLDLVGLKDKEKSFPDELSGGEQQRVAIARAFANNPSVIIADEPTGNIDPVMSREIMNLLLRINERMNRTVVVVTHDQAIVDHFKKRVISLHNGKVVSDRIGGMFNEQ